MFVALFLNLAHFQMGLNCYLQCYMCELHNNDFIYYEYNIYIYYICTFIVSRSIENKCKQ